jgi:hypothetical protein
MTTRIFGTLILASWLLCVTGCSSEVDIKKVATERESYAGKTVVSNCFFLGFTGEKLAVYPSPADKYSMTFVVPESLRKKANDFGSNLSPRSRIAVKYKVTKASVQGELGELVDIWVP